VVFPDQIRNPNQTPRLQIRITETGRIEGFAIVAPGFHAGRLWLRHAPGVEAGRYKRVSLRFFLSRSLEFGPLEFVSDFVTVYPIGVGVIVTLTQAHFPRFVLSAKGTVEECGSRVILSAAKDLWAVRCRLRRDPSLRSG
jgi:hypothetical protein